MRSEADRPHSTSGVRVEGNVCRPSAKQRLAVQGAFRFVADDANQLQNRGAKQCH